LIRHQQKNPGYTFDQTLLRNTADEPENRGTKLQMQNTNKRAQVNSAEQECALACASWNENLISGSKFLEHLLGKFGHISFLAQMLETNGSRVKIESLRSIGSWCGGKALVPKNFVAPILECGCS
jgi:hypothetical protein